MSNTTRRTTDAAAGGSGAKKGKSAGPKVKPASKKDHLIVPALHLSGDDDDEEDDDASFQAAFLPVANQPTSTFPQQPESNPTPEAVAGDATAATMPTATTSRNVEPTTVVGEESAGPDATPALVPERAPYGGSGTATTPAATTEAQPPAQSTSAADSEKSPTGNFATDGPAQEGSGQVEAAQRTGSALTQSQSQGARYGTAQSAATEIYGGYAGASMQVRRPGRRRPRQPYDPERPRDKGAEAMREMLQQAPRYAALLSVYSAAQTKTHEFGERNIHLYGVTADDAGLQGVADKALLKTLTMQQPKLTVAHYADAALQPVLARFNPQGTDREAMEDERDYLWQLAQKALAYRRYVLSDPQTARMPKYRAKGMLREEVNARFSRMLNLMDSFAGIEAKPFEIVSAILADFLSKLPAEQEGLKQVFTKHVVTTIQ